MEYDGEPGSSLDPLNDAAKAAKKKADKGHLKEVQQPAATVLKDGENHPNGEGGEGEGSGAPSDDEASLRQQYEELFNEKPGNMKVETMKERIAKKRKELGV